MPASLFPGSCGAYQVVSLLFVVSTSGTPTATSLPDTLNKPWQLRDFMYIYHVHSISRRV
jgi:hypothetical protein